MRSLRAAMRLPCLVALLVASAFARPAAAQQPRTGVVLVTVHEPMDMVEGLTVRSGTQATRTDADGNARLTLPEGRHVVRVTRIGFTPAQATVVVVADSVVRVTIAVEMAGMEMEAVRVSAARTERLVEDTPIRVEVIDEMEVDENTLMAPSGITMLLNETPGVRVQAASPALGTGSVRILGLPGQYTAMLADGLPLYGGATSALGPLDVSPVDLQRVEIIKGAASALYGGQALGGVVNLVSKPPSGRSEVLLNRRTMGVTDAATWLSRRTAAGGLSLLASGTVQDAQDVDDDGWLDQPRARRWGVRPRLTAIDEDGRALFVTAGYGFDAREGGRPTFREALTSHRADVGARVIVPLRDSGNVTVRAAASGNRRRRELGPGPLEDDATSTGFIEVTRALASRGGATVVGSALQLDRFASSLNPRFDHRWITPSLFATTDRALGPTVLSVSGRADAHPEAGLQVTERVALLVRPASDWSVRASVGTAFAAPAALTEETEAIGLRAIRVDAPLRRERSIGTMLDVSGKLAGAEVLATVYSSEIRDAIQLADARDGTAQGVLVNTPGSTRVGGLEAAAIWRVGEGGRFLGTYGYARGSRPDATTGVREPMPLLPRHRAGGDLMFEKPGAYRWGIEGIWYGAQPLDDNPYRTVSKPYLYAMAIAVRQLGRVEAVANFENLLDVRQTRTDPLLRPAPGTGGRLTTDVWAPLEGFMANVAVRYRW